MHERARSWNRRIGTAKGYTIVEIEIPVRCMRRPFSKVQKMPVCSREEVCARHERFCTRVLIARNSMGLSARRSLVTWR